MLLKTFLGIGVGVMAAAIAYGLLAGDLLGEARILLKYPWFHVSMIDLYVGFALVAAWIVFRERRPLVAVLWIVLLMGLGNLVSCFYALLAFIRAEGDMRRFWLGKHANSPGGS